ncbi:MAG: hypothetical protein AAGE52_27110 [Myxococcota bacterium]
MRTIVPGLLCLCLMGCVSAIPTVTGGSTTPKQRTDVALGGAIRVPTGDLRHGGPSESRARATADAGGVVPVAVGRYGLTRHLDLGLMVAGSVVRLDLRGEFGVTEGSTRSTWVWSIAPYGGYIGDRDDAGSGARFGLDIPLAYAIDFGGLYDVWIGPRIGIEGIVGSYDQGTGRESASLVALRGGAMIGMAAGFRRVHAFLEVTVAWEQQWGSHDDLELDRGGVVLIPAFGLRVRI